MTDVFSRQKRSVIMSRIKGRGNRATELRLIEVFRVNGFIGWRRNARVFGRPDFVFPKLRVAVFVDGCFWHGCPKHGQVPASNRKFWKQKLEGNARRDRLVNETLKLHGWRTVRIWQHEFRKPSALVRRLEKNIKRSTELANVLTQTVRRKPS
jgi:DNA mismatch endonuclease, patch repair protein